MANPSCSIAPEINGEGSILYNELLSKLNKNRPLTNYIYASYLQQGVATSMTSSGKKVNSQGEHSAEDVYNFFDVKSMEQEVTNIEDAKKKLGAIDDNYYHKPIADPIDAMQKVKDFNDTYNGLVATITFDGENYWYKVSPKTSRTIDESLNMDTKIQQWGILDNILKSINLDINTLASDKYAKTLINTSLNPHEILKNISNLKLASTTNPHNLRYQDIKLLLKIGSNDTVVDRIKWWFNNDIDDTIQGIYESLFNTGVGGRPNYAGSLSGTQRNLIQNTINKIGRSININFNDANSKLNTVSPSNFTLRESNVKKELDKLKQNYNIDVHEIHLKHSKNLQELEQVVARGLITLKRKKDGLSSKEDRSSFEEQELKLIKGDIDTISKNIAKGEYAQGCFKLLMAANDKLFLLDNLIKDLATTYNTKEETTFERANKLQDIKDIYLGYENLIKSLSTIEALDGSESLNVKDKENIKSSAKQLLESFESYRKVIETTEKATMRDLLELILGDELSSGKSIDTILEQADLDEKFFDKFYSFSRSTNDIVATMGTITRDAQLRRNSRVNDILAETKRIYREFKDAGGKNTEFMFEKDKKHIISDIDWDAYEAAKNSYKESLEAQGHKGFILDEEMRTWENNNSMKRVVDRKSGRTEFIPNSKYRKAFPSLTPAQKAYYDAIIDLKAEYETLMPKYAQEHYRPPQVRRSTGDVLFNPNSLKDMAKGIGTRVLDLGRIAEDNIDFVSNAITDDMAFASGDYSSNVKKTIPIFHIKRLSNPNEVSTDFTHSIEAELSSIINYDEMHKVLNVVEFMQDYVNSKISPVAKNKDKIVTERLQNQAVTVFDSLVTVGESRGVTPLMQSYIDMQFYGMRLKSESRFAPLVLKMIGYSSLKNLALNLKGGIANTLMGEAQMIIEACGAEFYNPKDYIWAHGLVLGKTATLGTYDMGEGKFSGGVIQEFFTNDRTSYDVLLSDYFGFMPSDTMDRAESGRYHNNPFRNLIGKLDPMGLYSVGEHLIHHINGFSVLHNKKVVIDGKERPLYYAFEKDPNNERKLKLKDSVTDLNGNPITDEYLKDVRGTILYVNQSCHGAMSYEDKSVLSQKLLGRSILNFRQWMVETYSRRYRDAHFDGTVHQRREGMWTTMSKLAKGLFKDAENYDRQVAIKWKDMNTMQKANVGRTLAALTMLGACFTLSCSLLDEDDWKSNYLMRMFCYQNKKVGFDLLATDVPIIGLIATGNTLLNTPIPCVSTVKGLMYPIFGINDIWEETRDGNNKYLHNILRYFLPFFRDIEQILNMAEDDNIFTVFSKDQFYR